jgi:ubiquinol-cytochrome c reductase cytochrome b subunit
VRGTHSGRCGVPAKADQQRDETTGGGIPPTTSFKDVLSAAVFAAIVFFVPTFGGMFLEAENFEPVNAASTPEHIARVWYFAPFPINAWVHC